MPTPRVKTVDPRVAPDPTHVKAHVKGGGDVEADEVHERDRRHGGPKHSEHRRKPLPAYEALARAIEALLER